MTLLPLGIPGLDLVLGGGIRTLPRVEGVNESATILLRGPPGSGKTLLGSQMASSLARLLKGPVAYGCIELLPMELAAQLAAFGAVFPPVSTPPFGPSPAIAAGLLDLGDEGAEVETIEPAIRALLEEVGKLGAKPRVLVLDSLSDGYRLGASVPRVVADGLCKLAAAEGLVLFLLEETVDPKPSPWSFAADVVIELGSAEEESVRGAAGQLERRLVVSKSRFGPVDLGPHLFQVDKHGVQVFPRPAAYLTAESAVSAFGGDWWEGQAQTWLPNVRLLDSLPFRRSVACVYGPEQGRVHRVATVVGATLVPVGPADGLDLWVRVDQSAIGYTWVGTQSLILPAGNPFSNGHRFVESVRVAFDALRLRNRKIRRVLFGDLRVLRTFRDPVDMRRALAVLVGALRENSLPCVLFETDASGAPLAVDFADATLLVRPVGVNTEVVTTNVRTGETGTQIFEPKDLPPVAPPGRT